MLCDLLEAVEVVDLLSARELDPAVLLLGSAPHQPSGAVLLLAPSGGHALALGEALAVEVVQRAEQHLVPPPPCGVGARCGAASHRARRG
eukprot:4760479-Prymnesium_polylepis.1